MRITSTGRHRAVAGLALAATAALTLSACSVTGAGGSSGGEGDGTGTINALFMKQAGYSESDVNAMIKDFEAKNPKITVKPTFVAYEALHDKIVTSAPAGTYDVVHLDVIWPAEFASKNIITDVTKRFPSSWKSEMLGGALSSAEYKGKYYGVPWGPSTKLFFYNKTMLAKVGATADDVKTWDGVLAVAKKLKDAGSSSTRSRGAGRRRRRWSATTPSCSARSAASSPTPAASSTSTRARAFKRSSS
jgi:multiple sugar transport system substrate-binding protein